MTTTSYSGQQISLRYPAGSRDGMLINITGQDVYSLSQAVEEFIEHIAPKLGELDQAVSASALVGKQLGGAPAQPDPTPQQYPATAPAPQQYAPPAQAAPGPQNQGPRSEQDRYGNLYEHGRPDAPFSPFGQAVLKHGKSQAGKAYTRWLDPRDPSIPSNSNGPRIAKEQLWDGGWGPRS